jgi:rod shape-determining protein MreC
MIKYIKEYRFYILLLFFLLIPLIAIDTSSRSPRDYRIYDRGIVALTSPIQGAISWSLDQIVNFSQNYLFLWHTRKDNLLLFEENRKLLGLIANLQEAEQENVRLKSLLAFKEDHHFETLLAQVIANDVSTEFRAIRINRGGKSGILKNMAVVTHEGVVGRILRTTDHTSDVITLFDLLSAVDATNHRSRARGVVEGLTDNTCQLRFALRTDDNQVNDLLVSSGLGGIFPKGIPIGTVIKVAKKSFGISQNVEIKPTVDFSKLEEVLIIMRAERGSI